MAVTWRRRPLIVAVALTTIWGAAACARTAGQSETVGTTGGDSAVIAIERTASYLTIENRAGLPLVELKVVLPAANGLSFSTLIPRLESGAKRDVAFAGLRSNDGTSFSPQWQRPMRIAVTATDLAGKKYDVTVPWK